MVARVALRSIFSDLLAPAQITLECALLEGVEGFPERVTVIILGSEVSPEVVFEGKQGIVVLFVFEQAGLD